MPHPKFCSRVGQSFPELGCSRGAEETELQRGPTVTPGQHPPGCCIPQLQHLRPPLLPQRHRLPPAGVIGTGIIRAACPKFLQHRGSCPGLVGSAPSAAKSLLCPAELQSSAGRSETPLQVLHADNMLGCQLAFEKKTERKRNSLLCSFLKVQILQPKTREHRRDEEKICNSISIQNSFFQK